MDLSLTSGASAEAGENGGILEQKGEENEPPAYAFMVDSFLIEALRNPRHRLTGERAVGFCYFAVRFYQDHMAAQDVGGDDGRIHIYVQDSIFMPDHNRVMRFITSRFTLQTCDEGHSWRYVTAAQKEWYWDEFVKYYRWDAEIDLDIRRVWLTNSATLYRRTIHKWRTTGHYPTTVTAARWASWNDVWNNQAWQERAQKNKANRASEPAGAGTGTCKHIAGSKTYSAHYQSMKSAQPDTDPSTWDLFLHTHRRVDGTFVDERSRLVHQSMDEYMDQSITPLDDGTIPDHPSSDEVNSMFQHVVGGRKKGRMYGCGSMAASFYPDEMAPHPRGGRRGGSSSQESSRLREDFEQQSRMVEYLRLDLQRSERRGDELQRSNDELTQRVTAIEAESARRMTSMEEQIRRLVSGIPQPPPTHPVSQSYSRPQYSSGVPIRARSTVPRFTPSSGRVLPRGKGKVLRLTDRHRHSTSQQWVDPSQDFGHADDDDDDADVADDADDGDDDETQRFD